MKTCICLLNKEMAMVLRTLKEGRKASFRIKQFLLILKIAKEKKTFSLKEFSKFINLSYSTTWVYLRMLRSLKLVKPIVVKKNDIFLLSNPRIFEYTANEKLLQTIFFFILNNFHCPIMTPTKTREQLKEKVNKVIMELYREDVKTPL